jgi:hypothetical protein
VSQQPTVILRGSDEWHARQQAECRRDFEQWCRNFDHERELAKAWTRAFRGGGE